MRASASTNRKLLTGVLGGLTFTAVGALVSLLQFSILIRRLPLEMAGIWMIITNLGSYVLFLDLGLSPTLGREISFAAGNLEFTDSTRAARIGSLIRSCTAAVSMLAILVVLFGAAAGWGYLHTVVSPPSARAARAAWFVYVIAVGMNLIGEGWFAGIYGLGFVFNEKIIRSVGALLGLIFMTIAVFSKSGFIGLAIASVLQSTCVLVIARKVLSRLAPYATARGGFDWTIIRELVGPSLKYAATLLGGIMILQTDNIVIASVLGPAAVPDYQAVAKIITLMMGLSMMLVASSMPIISQLHAKKDLPAIVHLLNRNLRFTLSLMVTIGSFLACFTDRLIAVWLGPQHFVGFPIVWVLLAVMLLEAHHQVMAAATVAAGSIVFLVPALLAGILNIGISIVLARHLGLVGVALGTMCAQVLTNNWYAPYYTIRLFKLSFAQHLRTVVLPLFGLIVLTLGTSVAARSLTGKLPVIAGIVVGGLSTITAGVSGMGILVAHQSERRALVEKFRMTWSQITASDLSM